MLDKIPACGDKFSFENLDVTVTETDFHRVSTIHVVRNEIEDEDEKKSKKDKDTRDADAEDDEDGERDGKKAKEKASV